MKKIWRNNGLTATLLFCFFLFWGAQTLTGWHDYNHQQEDYHRAEITLGSYLFTGHFLEATFENWESEFLQMAAYVMLSVSLYQKGSAESKDPDKAEETDAEPDPNRPDAPQAVKSGGFLLKLYQNSLSLAFCLLFLFSFCMHAVGGAMEYSHEQMLQGKPPISIREFMGTSEFWFQSFQNWQSEFLAVASIVVFTIFLRQKGSPESKPVDAPHSQTGSG
jgi:hypothetical protein